LRSKVKDSEWSNFGVEQLLGAANGEEPKREFGEKIKIGTLEDAKARRTIKRRTRSAPSSDQDSVLNLTHRSHATHGYVGEPRIKDQ